MSKDKSKILSIDFGQAFIKIAYLIFSGGKMKVSKYALMKASPAEEAQGLAAGFIKEFLKNNSIACKEAILNIWDTQKVFIKAMVFTAVPKEEMLEALKWQVKSELPFNVDGAIFDLQVVKEYTDDAGIKTDSIVCVAAESGFIGRYLAIAAECGLKAVRISSNPFNYSAILESIRANLSVTAVLDIGHAQAQLCIYRDNKLNFIRSLTFSSDKLTQSLSGTLVSDKGKFELNPQKAQGLIEKYGVPMDENAALENNISAIHIISLMRPQLEGLARELKRSFDYFCANFREEAPGILYLTGGGANLKNLDLYLNKELGMPVSVLPLPEGVEIEKGAEENLGSQHNQITGAIGAALGARGGINLLPHEIKTQKAEFLQKLSLRVISISAAAIFLFFLFVFNMEIQDYKNRLKTANAHLESIKEVKALKQMIELKEALIHKIKLNKVPVFGLFRLISNITPGNIFIEELSLDQERHILSFKGQVLSGANTAESELTDFIKKLEASSFVSEATLVSSQNISGNQQFEITCDLSH